MQLTENNLCLGFESFRLLKIDVPKSHTQHAAVVSLLCAYVCVGGSR